MIIHWQNRLSTGEAWPVYRFRPNAAAFTGDQVVAVTGVAGTTTLGTVTILTSFGEVTGVFATGYVGQVLVWGDTIDDQTPGWSEIDSSETDDWSEIDDSETDDWVEIVT